MNQPAPAATSLLTAPAPLGPSQRGRSERETPTGFDAQLDAAVEASQPAPEKPPAPERAAPAPPPEATAEEKANLEIEEAEALEAEDFLDPATAVEATLLATVAVSETVLLASSSSTVLPSEAVTSVDVHAAANLPPAAPLAPAPTEGTFPPSPVAEGTTDEVLAPAPAAGATVPTIVPAEQTADEATDPAAASTVIATTVAATPSEVSEPQPTTGESDQAAAADSSAPVAETAAEPVAAVQAESEDSEQGEATSTEIEAPATDAPLVAADATTPAAHESAAASLGAESSTTSPSVDPTAVRPAQDPGAPAPRAEAVEGGAGESSRPEVDPGRFVSRVSRAIDFARERGGGPIEMRLSPPELGSMQVRIELKEGVMTASLEVDNPAARTTLLDNLPALRDRLEQQQIRIDKFDVEVRDDQQRGGDWRQQQDQQQSGDRQSDRPSPRPLRPPVTGTTTQSSVAPQRTSPFGPSGGINLVA